MARFHKAVWSSPGADYADGPDSVGPMVDRLARAGFDLIVPVVKGGGGYVSYHSRIGKVQPQFEAWYPLRVLVEKSKAAGIKVHPWMCVFPEGEHSPLFDKDESLRMVNRDGERTPWACPSSETVRKYERSLFEEVMDEYDVAGVHMDYIRYNSEDVCFCERCRSGFKAETGTDPLEIGKVSEFNVYSERGKNRKHPDWSKWVEWRAGWVTKFVEELSASVKDRGKELSAAVFMEYPECVVYEGQNWGDWGERELVDVMMPMTYTNSTLMVRRRTRNHIAQVKGGCRVWAGLGKGSSRSVLSTEMLVEQVQAARQEGAEGIAVFSHAALTDEDLAALAGMG
ncbi:MAG: family 10 glycosylhydrolase [Candidatus Latescibacteria bacterium]|nr:family 10 glycosylhydrolase [Candidatus Latescibacterota bacterium]